MSGWQVLLGEATGKAGTIPRLFAGTATLFGVAASTLALFTQRWGITWVCALGGWFASVDGVLAIWSRQSSAGEGSSGPGIGLVLAVIAMIVIASQWLRTAWSRPAP